MAWGKLSWLCPTTLLQRFRAYPNSIENGELAEPNAVEEIWNGFNYTRDEQQFRDSVGSDLETFINETEDAFITGRKSFDEWDNYVAQVDSLGLEEYMSIQEEAYARYQDVVE
ncbi:hypothetical protein [Bacillus sp. JCM 19041]|uniref:hypothetical protein n=1 Tax=Bacillus sp. JCM 19041 TaxID=1460637 RepID=UPI00336A42EC